jgi:hypothetical protein
LSPSCSKITDDNDSNNENKEIEYYVKYASDGLGGQGIYAYDVSYTDETGQTRKLSEQSSDSFERIIGPVRIDFEAQFRISVKNTNDTKTRTARIEVKKGDAPFVVKAEKSGKGFGGVSVSYTIK